MHDHIVPLNYISQEICGGFVGFGFGVVDFFVINKAFELKNGWITSSLLLPKKGVFD